MCAAGLVEVFLGVDAEQKSLENLAVPLSSADEKDEPGDDGGADIRPLVHNPSPKRMAAVRSDARTRSPWARTGRVGWAPMPQASIYPLDNPYLQLEIDGIERRRSGQA